MNRMANYLRHAALTLALLALAGTAQATAPRFADKDTALDLSQILDKGLFRDQLISSTFVMS